MRRRAFIAGFASAAAWPVVARAQQPKMPIIGWLNLGSSESDLVDDAFHQGLNEQGYFEGRNVEILHQRAAMQFDRLPGLAAYLVRRQVSVIVAAGGGTPTARAAKSATATIPIVFAIGTDPIDVGLVASLSRPGGNVTGVTFLAQSLTAKRLELLREVLPAAKSIGYPINYHPDAEIRAAQDAADALGVRLVVVKASTPGEIEAAFARLKEQQIDAWATDSSVVFTFQGTQLATLAARHAVPAIYPVRATVEAGGLMSYGGSAIDAYRLVGTYAGRILRGEKPAELPVQQTTRIEMVVNLKTAKALGLTIPPTLLVRADEVIE